MDYRIAGKQHGLSLVIEFPNAPPPPLNNQIKKKVLLSCVSMTLLPLIAKQICHLCVIYSLFTGMYYFQHMGQESFAILFPQFPKIYRYVLCTMYRISIFYVPWKNSHYYLPPRRRPGDGRYCNAPRPSVTFSFRTVTVTENALMYFLETSQVRAPCHGGVLYSFLY